MGPPDASHVGGALGLGRRQGRDVGARDGPHNDGVSATLRPAGDDIHPRRQEDGGGSMGDGEDDAARGDPGA